VTKKVLIVGSSGGLGSACVVACQQQNWQVRGLTSADIDLNFPERVFDLDLSGINLLINCSGHSQGTYLGFLKNSWQNQLSQITVNYTANLALLKHFANSCNSGKYVWISTSLMHQGQRPFHSIYLSTKQASKMAIDLIRQEATHIDVLEVNVGPTRTNFRQRNFLYTKSAEEINMLYDQDRSHTPDHVAQQIISAVMLNCKELHL